MFIQESSQFESRKIAGKRISAIGAGWKPETEASTFW
jgi:hypothetical protein